MDPVYSGPEMEARRIAEERRRDAEERRRDAEDEVRRLRALLSQGESSG